MIEFSTKKIIDSCNKQKKEKYNILTFPTHERYETQLAKTGHNFYSFHLENLKKWNSDQIDVPINYFIMPEGDTCAYIEYDFILSQSKFWQFQAAQQIQKMINVPIISLEHTLPTPQTIPQQHLEAMRNMCGDINVFISEYSAKEWNISDQNIEIIHHGINTAEFIDMELEREDHILSVANDFVKRDYCLNYSGWKRVTNGLKTKLIGDTEGLSKAAESTLELVTEYNKCGVYFNSSTLSPIPTSLLEAMSCGCPVVSTATCMIPEIIENGVNGFISNDENELRSRLEYLLYNKDFAKQMGQKARETIQTKFPENVFVDKWNSIFDHAYRISQK
jgi:hypothetical protein